MRSQRRLRVIQVRAWALRAGLGDLLEITFANAADRGVEAADLVADDPAACQELAARLRGVVPGLIVPSAALPGTQNIVLFGARVASPYLAQPQSALDVPASIVAEGGRPPESLAAIVRYRSEPHAALVAHQRGAPFRFTEPDWSPARA